MSRIREQHRASLGTTIELPIPLPDEDIFKYGATANVLAVLADNPDFDFSIRQLSSLTASSEKAVRGAIGMLVDNDLVIETGTVRPNRYHINRARLQSESDPVRDIPQSEFQAPVKIAQLRLEDALDDIAGILLFGSVARGEADSQSDIDLWVLVKHDLHEQRHRANNIAKELRGLQIPPTLSYEDYIGESFDKNWSTYKQLLNEDSQEWDSATRYSFQIIVEEPTSFINQSELVKPEQLFGRGITLVSSDLLERVKKEVFDRVDSNPS